MVKCGKVTEIYSRVCGYHRPVKDWNKGKKEEFRDRRVYTPEKWLLSITGKKKKAG